MCRSDDDMLPGRMRPLIPSSGFVILQDPTGSPEEKPLALNESKTLHRFELMVLWGDCLRKGRRSERATQKSGRRRQGFLHTRHKLGAYARRHERAANALDLLCDPIADDIARRGDCATRGVAAV